MGIEKVLERPYIDIGYDAERSLLKAVWTADSIRLTDKEFRSVNDFYVSHSLMSPYHSLMIDTREFHYTIPPDMQAWVGTQVVPALIANGLRRIAFMVSNDFIAQLSIEQAMEEADANAFAMSYFDDLQAAEDWLMLS